VARKGVPWDTLQRHWDPGLASRESVASLTNPSHLLIALGMSIAVLGVGYGLYCSASSRVAPRPSTGAAIAVVVLATLWLGTTSVAPRTGGISGRHDHGGASSSKPHGHGGAARDTPPR